VKKKLHEIERMSPVARRRFLKGMASLLAAAGADQALRFACDEVAGGVAYADNHAAAKPTYFIEIDLRDQWDHAHVMVAPGLATNTNLRRGSTANQCAMFAPSAELKKTTVNGTDVYLTNDSVALQPHLDNVAMIDCCEVAVGAIHGHEAANPMRSPGRTYNAGGGKMAMFNLDPVANFPQGVEAYYSSTPTPATLHNYHQKQIDSGARNGVAFKGISRSIHTAYHFGAGLPNAELDRLQSLAAIYSAFPEKVEDLRILDTAEQADALVKVLDRVDRRFLERRGLPAAIQDDHVAKLGASRKILHDPNPRIINPKLTAAEATFWKEGVPNQVAGGPVKAQIWESLGIATKLVTNDLVRSIAVEFDYVDFHGGRQEGLVRTMAQQISRPLARMIQKLKEANIFDRTVIAVYCVDGSREAKADSYGNAGKNTVILAGGKIRGGYFGDVRVASNAGDGHEYSYHAPDLTTGAIRPNGALNNDGRVSGASVWRTVMKALAVPDVLCARFPDVAGAAALPFLLRA
jgi:hypothetical protein